MNTFDRHFLQVLVLHKNQPKKLTRLLESIPTEVNVIVVDDNSASHYFDACKQMIDTSPAYSNSLPRRWQSGC